MYYSFCKKKPLQKKCVRLIILSCLMLFSLTLSAFAVESRKSTPAEIPVSHTGSTTETMNYPVSVYATKGSSFTVKLPVSITMKYAFGGGTADYWVFVKGDVRDDSSVTIRPQNTSIEFAKTEGNTSSSITGTVSQEVTNVHAADIGTDYPQNGQLNGNVSVTGLTAGKWKASMVFQISYTYRETVELEVKPDELNALGPGKVDGVKPFWSSESNSFYFDSMDTLSVVSASGKSDYKNGLSWAGITYNFFQGSDKMGTVTYYIPDDNPKCYYKCVIKYAGDIDVVDNFYSFIVPGTLVTAK